MSGVWFCVLIRIPHAGLWKRSFSHRCLHTNRSCKYSDDVTYQIFDTTQQTTLRCILGLLSTVKTRKFVTL